MFVYQFSFWCKPACVSCWDFVWLTLAFYFSHCLCLSGWLAVSLSLSLPLLPPFFVLPLCLCVSISLSLSICLCLSPCLCLSLSCHLPVCPYLSLLLNLCCIPPLSLSLSLSVSASLSVCLCVYMYLSYSISAVSRVPPSVSVSPCLCLSLPFRLPVCPYLSLLLNLYRIPPLSFFPPAPSHPFPLFCFMQTPWRARRWLTLWMLHHWWWASSHCSNSFTAKTPTSTWPSCLSTSAPSSTPWAGEWLWSWVHCSYMYGWGAVWYIYRDTCWAALGICYLGPRIYIFSVVVDGRPYDMV